MTPNAASADRRSRCVEIPKRLAGQPLRVTEESDADEGASAGEQLTGRFLVTHAEDQSAILQHPVSSQVYTLSENPELSAGTVVEGTLQADPPFGATWQLIDRESARQIPIERTDLAPTRQSKETAADQPVGELTRIERAGEGELHVITVPKDRTDSAADDVIDDQTTLAQAARVGADRVEVRTEPGLVVVRYLPD